MTTFNVQRFSMMPCIAIACIAVACGDSSNRAAPAQTVNQPTQNPNQAVVTFADATNPETVRDMREKAGADLVTILPRTKAEVWQFRSNAAQAVASLQADARVNFAEAFGQAATAFSNLAADMNTFDAADMAKLQRLTSGAAATDYKVLAARPANLNADVIAVNAQARLAIPLLTDAPVFAREASQQLASGDFTWVGNAVEAPGEAMLIVRAGGITGRVRLGRDTYSILPLADGRQLVRRDTSAQYPPEHPTERDAGAPPAAPNADTAPAASCQPADSDIDVFVTYSEEVKQLLTDPGGTAALGVIQANRSFQNSNIPLALNLVGVQPSGYHETGDYDKDVAAMKNGAISGLFKARDATAADVVVMLVANQQFCGMAADILASPGTAFAAVAASCATGNLSFAHEVGHLFGARHDRPIDDSDRPFKYGHGYALKNEWRSVMAYPGACNCPRQEFWADSAITRKDSQNALQPSGVKDLAEDARVLRQTGSQLAQFRCRSSQTTH